MHLLKGKGVAVSVAIPRDNQVSTGGEGSLHSSIHLTNHEICQACPFHLETTPAPVMVVPLVDTTDAFQVGPNIDPHGTPQYIWEIKDRLEVSWAATKPRTQEKALGGVPFDDLGDGLRRGPPQSPSFAHRDFTLLGNPGSFGFGYALFMQKGDDSLKLAG